VEIARQAIEGGARLIQYRDKTREKGNQLPICQALQALCRETNALFFVNDHVDLALTIAADGVHLGQRDLPVGVVRKIISASSAHPEESGGASGRSAPGRLVGRAMLIGASTNNAEEARRAEADGADYVSVGRLFPTGSKSDTRPATLDTLREVKAAVSVPVCAIGGINDSNIADVIGAGADMAAVISAVVGAADVRSATERLTGLFR
jgi:thiamine monophosphate synthase